MCLVGTIALLPATNRYFRRGVPGFCMRPFDEFLRKNPKFANRLREG